MQPRDATLRPPHPVMALQVGVCGHRSLGEADADRLRDAAAAVFRTLRSEILRLHEADQATAAPIYQAAAPQARCISGLAEGADCLLAEAALAEGWSLVVTLPFPRAEFERDFTTDPSRDRFRTLLARATTVCELDGERAAVATPYAAVGEQITEQSDLLLAVWDGLPAHGPGGTGEVVGEALRRGVPVGVLPTSGPADVTWRGAGSAGPGALVQAALLPPAGEAGFPQAYFNDVPRGAAWAAASIRAFERVVSAGVNAAPASSGPAPPPAAPPELSQCFAVADHLASRYAALYRAAGLMRYGLILPATLASLIGWYGPTWLRPFGSLAEFIILVIIVAFSAKGWWERSHRRFIAYRAVAEYLRNARLLAPLAALARMPGPPPHLAQSADWTAWYGRAVVRSVGLQPLHFTPEAVAAATASVRAEAAAQMEFLSTRAARFDVMARRLRHIGVFLSVCGIVFTAMRAAFLYTQLGERPMRVFDELALLLPAMAPVFLGLLSFNEYATLATRYRATAAELQAQLAALDHCGDRRAPLLRVARHIADIMLAETADWRLLIKERVVSAY